MFRRRGCGVGCFGILLVCVVLGLIGWFVGVPRSVDWLEEGISNRISTAISNDLLSGYSRDELQQGAQIRIPFTTINENLVEPSTTADEATQVERVEVSGRGDDLVMSAWFNGDEYEIAYTPEIDDEGQLNMNPVSEGNWFQQLLTDVLGGGMERSINIWLDQYDLVLTNVTLDGDTLVLTVTGK